MDALKKEELRLLKLLVQNLEAQLMKDATYQKYMEAKALQRHQMLEVYMMKEFY